MTDLKRWRLVLGKSSSDLLDRACGATAEDLARDAALEWLYDRDTTLADRDIRTGDLSESQLTVPTWINDIHRLFPKETVERLERIFARFFTSKAQGLGMGLPISRAIAEAHGGRMWASADGERGLTLHIELPCETRPPRS